MKLTIPDLVICLTLRRVFISSSNFRKTDILSLLTSSGGELSSDELDTLKIVKKRMFDGEATARINEYSPSELKTMLEIFNDQQLHVGISYLAKDDKQRIIMSIAHEMGMGIFFPPEWNDRQREVISAVVSQESPTVVVVNAGPGTGKTSVACERTMRLKDEGVIFCSYTNETVNEAYRRLHLYPGTTGVIGRNEWSSSKKVIVGTIDSLVSFILGEGGEEAKSSSSATPDYESSVAAVNAMILHDKKSVIRRMYDQEKKRMKFSHIIIDEAQDISDNRAELIFSLMKNVRGFKTLTILGDPRQRLRGVNGGWYSRMWTNEDPKVVKIGLDVSYRFKNTGMFNVVNHISRTWMPSLHVELVPPPGEEIDEENCPIMFWDRETWYPSSCAVSISLDTSIATGRLASAFVDEIRDLGGSVSTSSQGSFRATGSTLVATVPSVKGKEFDVVYAVGLNNFDRNFSQIPDAESVSMMYVLHSRARQSIQYVMGKGMKMFSLPRVIDPMFFNEKDRKAIVVDRRQPSSNGDNDDFLEDDGEDIMRQAYSPVPDRMYRDQSFLTFLATNGMTVTPSGGGSLLLWLKHVMIEGEELPNDTIKSSHPKVRWTFMIEMFARLKTHVDKMTIRENVKRRRGQLLPTSDEVAAHSSPLFAVDTEFIPTTKEIFEIAIVNIHNPFRSIISPVKTSTIESIAFSAKYTGRPKELFETAPTMESIIGLFSTASSSLSSEKPVLLHYVAPIDVAWALQMDFADAVNLGPEARTIASTRGVISSQPPHLGEFYNLFSTPIVMQPHLKEHIALCDSLLLIELVRLNILLK